MKNLILSFCSLLISHFSVAQCADMGLYAFSRGGSDSNYVLHYNPLTEAFDIVMQLDGIFGGFPNDAAVDAYNGRLFLCEHLNQKFRIVTVDLNTGAVTRSGTLIDLIGNIEYDIFKNKLVIRDYYSQELFLYNLTADTIHKICDLTFSSKAYTAGAVYNQLSQNFVYSVPGPGKSIDIYAVNVNNKEVFKTCTYDSIQNFLYYQAFDFNTNRIIGIRLDKANNDTIEIVSLDYNSGIMTNISNIMLSFGYGNSSSSRAVFDASNNLYYFPYYDFYPVIEVIDINNGNKLKTINSDFNTVFHQFHGAYAPVLKLRSDSTLIVTYGKSYQWYYNGTKIDGAIAQTYKPRLPGFYTVDVTFSCGRKETTKELYADVHEIVNNDLEEGEIQVYNNVAAGNDDATVVFHNPDKAEHNLLIYNSLGQLVQSHYRISANFINIHSAAFASGIYYFRLFKAHKTVGHGKLLVP